MVKLRAKFFALFLMDAVLWVFNLVIASWVVSMFTRAQPDLNEHGKPWGGWFGTWDNPPQGDEKYQRECMFPGVTTGLKGYWNRVGWLRRNPLYGFNKWAGIPYKDSYEFHVDGNENISDKDRVPGSYYAKVIDAHNGKVVAFEYYLVKPWRIGSFEKCIRVRLGWKVMTDKFERYGFATLVDTANPFKSYGDL